MKSTVKLLVAIGISMGVRSASSQQNFNYDISGTIPGAEKVLLSADQYGMKILDSVKNSNGKFSFKGTSNSVSLGALIVESKRSRFTNYHSIFIEPGKVKVRLHKGTRLIEARGSKNNDIMSAAEAQNLDFWAKAPLIYDSINYASMRLSELHKDERVNEDSTKYYQALYKRMEEAAQPYVQQRNEKLKLVFERYPQTLFTAYYALNSAYLPDDALKAMYSKFDETIKNSNIGKEWYARLFQSQNLETGTDAPSFSTTDLEGKTVSLSDYKGKYVLLDFWATWCTPCRAGHPHLIELYSKYKDQGLQFIGIADDDKNIAGWKKAVKTDGIGLWPHVLRGREKTDQNGEPADLSKMYKVDSYPTKILVDKEGKIIGHYHGDEELEKVFAELFNKKS